MDADDLPFKEETRRILGAAFSVLNELGHGLHEKPYENALVVEFGALGIACEQQRLFPVMYRGVQVAEYIPDLIAFGNVIVDTKVIERITDHERGQMMNYLRISKRSVGLILNFKRAKLEWARVVLSEHPR